jgi:hypothetical protein
MTCKACKEQADKFKKQLDELKQKLSNKEQLTYLQKRTIWGPPLTRIVDGKIQHYWVQELTDNLNTKLSDDVSNKGDKA